MFRSVCFNPLNAELNPICHLLALLDHHILHINKIRVNEGFPALIWYVKQIDTYMNIKKKL